MPSLISKPHVVGPADHNGGDVDAERFASGDLAQPSDGPRELRAVDPGGRCRGRPRDSCQRDFLSRVADRALECRTRLRIFGLLYTVARGPRDTASHFNASLQTRPSVGYSLL